MRRSSKAPGRAPVSAASAGPAAFRGKAGIGAEVPGGDQHAQHHREHRCALEQRCPAVLDQRRLGRRRQRLAALADQVEAEHRRDHHQRYARLVARDLGRDDEGERGPDQRADHHQGTGDPALAPRRLGQEAQDPDRLARPAGPEDALGLGQAAGLVGGADRRLGRRRIERRPAGHAPAPVFGRPRHGRGCAQSATARGRLRGWYSRWRTSR